MLFNSLDFAVFLPIVFILYWFCFQKSLKLQNLFVVVASYYFYGSWAWRYLMLIFACTVVNFVSALLIERATKRTLSTQAVAAMSSSSPVAAISNRHNKGNHTNGNGDGDIAVTGNGDEDIAVTGNGDEDIAATENGDGDIAAIENGDEDIAATGNGDEDIAATGNGDWTSPLLDARKVWLWVGIILSLSLLGFYKYYNFFVENFVSAFTLFGARLNIHTLKIILPVGISFFTFQTMSYTIDVYRGKMKATKDFVAFMAFVSFFPQLVAGPIERATNLLPQFLAKRSFDYDKAVDGLRQILWGLVKKVLIADSCAVYVNEVFGNHQLMSGSSLVLGAVFFAFQIYCDFSGYSDIAIGVSRLFGINLMRNFAYPYFSRDIAEFWRRWHISLSTWFRDYVYIPLGGSRVSQMKVLRNTFIIFLVSGFWHGANWTFVVWGLFHALCFLPLILSNKNRTFTSIVAEDRVLPNVRDTLRMLGTFALVLVGWVIFRADSMVQAVEYLAGIFTSSSDALIAISSGDFQSPLSSFFSIVLPGKAIKIVIFITIFTFFEWIGRRDQYAIEKFSLSWKRIYRWAFYYALIGLMWINAAPSEEFIYFQF